MTVLSSQLCKSKQNGILLMIFENARLALLGSQSGAGVCVTDNCWFSSNRDAVSR